MKEGGSLPRGIKHWERNLSLQSPTSSFTALQLESHGPYGFQIAR